MCVVQVPRMRRHIVLDLMQPRVARWAEHVEAIANRVHKFKFNRILASVESFIYPCPLFERTIELNGYHFWSFDRYFYFCNLVYDAWASFYSVSVFQSESVSGSDVSMLFTLGILPATRLAGPKRLVLCLWLSPTGPYGYVSLRELG